MIIGLSVDCTDMIEGFWIGDGNEGICIGGISYWSGWVRYVADKLFVHF